MQRLKRSEVPVQETWDLSDLFPTTEAWEAELEAVVQDVQTVTQYRNRLHESADVLAACLDAEEEISKRFSRLFARASFHLSTDTTDPNAQADFNRVSSAHTKATAAFSFIKSELLALPDDTITKWLNEHEHLATHRLSIAKMLELKPYTLSPETEAVLSSLSEVMNAPRNVYTISKGADMKFEQAIDSYGSLHAVYDGGPQLSPDPVLRRNAYAAFTKGLSAYRNTFATTFATEVNKNVTLANLRGYESATDMQLKPHQVTRDVYENVLDILSTELAPHMRRYQSLRQKQLGLDKMLYCDLTVPLGDEPEVTFEEAQTWCLDALQVLGEEYHTIMREMFEKGWIDRANNEGKRSGAFCSTIYGVHSYIFMTWQNQMRPVFTLAHELGHAGHLSLACRNQRYNDVRPALSFIESPSTMNEMLLAQHLLKNSSDKQVRRSVIMGLMGTYHHNYVNHLLEAELQRRIYALAEAGKPITEQVLSNTTGQILAEFWGDVVEIDEGARLLWMRQPHYYMSLYPYTYALGLTISTAAAQKIAEEGQPAIDRWLDVLKAGGTLTTVELAQLAGVDITKPDVIRKAVAYVGALVDELEKSFE
jgi:oligoendopeptidase F